MKRIVIAALLIAALSGCNMKKHGEHTAESYQRWAAARANVVADLAGRYYDAGELDKAQEQATEALKTDKDNVPAMILLGKIFIEKDKYAKAIDQLRVAEAVDRNNPEVAFLIGVAMEKRGEHAEALKHYRKARSLDKANDDYVLASAEVLVSMGQPARALEIVNARLDSRDSTAAMNGLAGELAMMLGLNKRAIGYYRDCLSLQPDSAHAREGLARALFFAGNYGEAADVLKGLAAEKEFSQQSWVHIMLGDCYVSLNQPGAAQASLTKASELSPKSAKVWNDLAKATLAAGDIPGAMVAANRAMGLGGDGLEATLVVAYGLMRQGKSLDAARMLDAAAQKHPSDATVLCVLGRCYQKLGRPDQAASLYRRALLVDPANPLAQSLVATAQDPKKIR